jgi:hypothetical protein
MNPAVSEPKAKSDSAVLGILAGLGIGLAVAVVCVLLFVLLWGSHGAIVAVPFLLPPASVVVVGINAHRNDRLRFTAGLFIAAALVSLLECTCAAKM